MKDRSSNSYQRRRPSSKSRETSSEAGTGRLGQVTGLLKQVLTWREAADTVLSRYFRENRALGARDRSQVADAIFDVLRHLRRYRHDAQSWPGNHEQALAIRGLYNSLDEASRLLVLDADQQAWANHGASIDQASLAFGLRYSLPDWIEQTVRTLPEPQSYAAALLKGASVDLRVNTLKGTRDDVLAQIQRQLEGSGFEAHAMTYSPDGIRLTGHPPINRWELFEQGVIEVQDEGSQLLAHLVAPKRGEMVIDFCAGAGGKTLALGALMRSTGRLYAFDVSAARLARAKPRFARSGLSNVHPVVIRNERDDRVARLAGKAHRVLVDAPCTGLGTLRRNPDLKWRQTPASLARLCQEQANILTQAAKCVRPGGRLVYATCSFLPEENEQQIERFLENHPDFALLNATDCLGSDLKKGSDAAQDDGVERTSTKHNPIERSDMLRLRPDWHGTDGFFAAVLQRAAQVVEQTTPQETSDETRKETPKVKPEVTPEVEPEVTSEVKPEGKP